LQSEFRAQGRAVQGLVILAALALFAVAALIGPAWMERHFLPEFFHPRAIQLHKLANVRIACVVAGLVLLWPLSPWLGRLAARKPPRELALDIAPTLVAIVLALIAAEVLLQRLPWFAEHEVPGQREPLRRRDPVMGWAYVPNRVGRGELGGRMIDYAIDPAGHRVRAAGDAVDYAAPTILFVGESIIGGHGLTYDETIPAQTGARLGLQPANLAVGGFATDQMYLRLKAEWPRYRQPRALVILFMPSLFHRNLDTDRPHLTPELAWRPPSDALRLFQLAHRVVPYRTDADIADAVAMTRRALSAMVDMARAKGAVPVILVPQLTPETAEERAIEGRALTDLPVVQVNVDPTWRVPNNRHPDARAAARIADAVAVYLVEHHVRPAASQPVDVAPSVGGSIAALSRGRGTAIVGR